MEEQVKVTKEWMDALAGVRRVICHRNSAAQPCPDGVAAAIAIHDALPNATIEFRHHGPDLDSVEPMPGLLFADICPRLRTREHAEAGAIVLDHHKSHEAEVCAFGARGVFGNETQSGAFLAWDRVWKHLATANGRPQAEMRRAEAFALLASVRDTWQKEHPWWSDACEAAEALAFYDWSTWSRLERPFWDGPGFGNSVAFDRLLEVGKPLRAQRLRRAEEAARSAMRFTSRGGTRFVAINTLDTSDVADLFEVGTDVIAGFHCAGSPSGDIIRFSLRSRSDYDVGALAKVFDGGGHRAAAGFTIPTGTIHPVDHLRNLVDAIEDTASVAHRAP